MGKILALIIILTLIFIPIAYCEKKYQIVGQPGKGKIYHAGFPGTSNMDGEEDGVTLNDIRSFEKATGKTCAWIYFSNSWYTNRKTNTRAFPLAIAKMIKNAGSVPYVRMMLWSEFYQNRADPTFTLQRIIKGDFDKDIKAWGKSAKEFGSPIIAEYGTEMNGDWFPWNGVWNGGKKTDGYGDKKKADGPERFIDAYKRIIRLCREQGAYNIIWTFHVNHSDWPGEDWNKFENYYPGDDWIDWIGVSIYGAQTPMQEREDSFTKMMDKVYPRLTKLSKTKPIVLCEFAVTNGHPKVNQANWAEDALKNLTSLKWPRVIGFSWWNDFWTNDDDPKHNTNMRVQDNPKLSAVFKKYVGSNKNVLGKAVLTTKTIK